MVLITVDQPKIVGDFPKLFSTADTDSVILYSNVTYTTGQCTPDWARPSSTTRLLRRIRTYPFIRSRDEVTGKKSMVRLFLLKDAAEKTSQPRLMYSTSCNSYANSLSRVTVHLGIPPYVNTFGIHRSSVSASDATARSGPAHRLSVQ